MTRLLRIACLTAPMAFVLAPSGASALQQLLATPYPSGLGATALDVPSGAVTHRHQRLIDDPAPRGYGMNAQGNPHRVHDARHQRLLRTPYPRQFR